MRVTRIKDEVKKLPKDKVKFVAQKRPADDVAVPAAPPVSEDDLFGAQLAEL